MANKKNINKFTIKDLECSRRRKNIIIESSAISKKINSFFPKIGCKINEY